ncbi:MAG: hypothetical protein OHK0046_49300 [Anaerolineae bacterium]
MIERIFNVSRYTTEAERYQARITYVLVGLLLSFFTLYAFAVPEWESGQAPSELLTMFEFITRNNRPDLGILLIGFTVIGLLTFVTTWLGLIYTASWGPVFMWYIGGVALLLTTTDSPGDASAAVILLLLLAGLLNGRKGILAAWLLASATLIIRWYGTSFPPQDVSLASILLQVLGGAALVYLFLLFARFSRFAGAAEAVESRVAAAEVVTQIARRVAARAPLDVLLSEVVERLVSRFDFIYQAQVFIISDDGQSARLVASSGEIGRQLLERQHSLGVGTRSVIGQVTFRGAAVVAHPGDGVHRANDLLPETRVEAAFPLRIGDRIVGALDVQSRLPDSFKDENTIAAFQALADSITLAIDNAQQYETNRQRLQENAALMDQTHKALDEVRRLNERLMGRAWSDYLRGTGDKFSLEIDFEAGRQAPAEWTTTLQEAMQHNHLVQAQHDDRQVISVPLQVRGHVIGAMEFELDEDYDFAPEDLDLVQSISERFGLAMENARLVDESQRAAEREALVNEISTRLQSFNNIESMVTDAAQTLHNVLKAERVSIRLGTPEAKS